MANRPVGTIAVAGPERIGIAATAIGRVPRAESPLTVIASRSPGRRDGGQHGDRDDRQADRPEYRFHL
jgi:hypothetical protein